ncbi:hypothetical protein [Kribbella italica]|uniref:Uncharacterized protein n=1 Tax=Kribbella italica TaxID=1540520 RepID=A0A7W9J0M4_9ACTN|nr:hypothetical protein [Kribbella italica]MBB5833451.1 hypothetical protein [Kribbella italica]
MKTVAHSMCPCGKRSFASERLAEKALGKAKASHRARMEVVGSRRIGKQENRFYLCQAGDAYHLTSESRRDYQMRTIPAPTLTWEQFQASERRAA